MGRKPIIAAPVELARRILFCSVLETVTLVRHYGSDRSCYLPRLNLVSEAVLVQVVVSPYLLVCSLRVTRTLCRRLFFSSLVFFFSIKSNSVKSWSWPEQRVSSILFCHHSQRGPATSREPLHSSEVLQLLPEGTIQGV